MEWKLPRDPPLTLHLDAISQFPFLNGYTHMLRVFEATEEKSRDYIATEVQNAFEYIKSKIPWLGGQIVVVNGLAQIAPWPSGAHPNEVIRKDSDGVLSSFTEIMAAGGPISMFPGERIVPCPGLPAPHGINGRPIPVAILPLVFIVRMWHE